LLFFGINSFGQKFIGVGGELSVMGLKPNARIWVSRPIGFEIFGGFSAELGDYKFNDYEGGLKYLHTFLYSRTNRTYFGLMGKLNWIDLAIESNIKTNLPVAGVLIGSEWFSKRSYLKGIALELGYQYGVKNYNINHFSKSEKPYREFPLIINLRYSIYKKTKV